MQTINSALSSYSTHCFAPRTAQQHFPLSTLEPTQHTATQKLKQQHFPLSTQRRSQEK
uniref:Uncharacterized protein n=1 Tax=Desertifilum tharense IPPAS B-1220 TaxID=1781255 RepID=A0ACD5H171_9CYAN